MTVLITEDPPTPDDRTPEEIEAAALTGSLDDPFLDPDDDRSPEEINAAADTGRDRLAPNELRLTMFSKNRCHECGALKKYFLRKGVPFDEINVEEDTAPRREFGGLTPLEYVMANYGRKMPTLVIEDGEWNESWNGANPDKAMEIVKRFADAGLLVPEDQRIDTRAV